MGTYSWNPPFTLGWEPPIFKMAGSATVNNEQFKQWKLKIDKNGFKKCNIKVMLVSSKNGRICHVDSV